MTQWPLAAKYRNKLTGHGEAAGLSDLRAELAGQPPEPRKKRPPSFRLIRMKKTPVVTGASLGAKTNNDAMLAMLKDANACASAFESSWQIPAFGGAGSGDRSPCGVRPALHGGGDGPGPL